MPDRKVAGMSGLRQIGSCLVSGVLGLIWHRLQPRSVRTVRQNCTTRSTLTL